MKRWIKRICLSVILISVGSSLYHVYKPIPEGISYISDAYELIDGEFIFDQTLPNPNGGRKTQQSIFDTVFDLIKSSREFILIDMFLFNDYVGKSEGPFRPLSSQLTDAIVAQKQAFPKLQVVFITDPINDVYGALPSAQLQQLRDAGVTVVITDLNALRDSNPTWSGFWRVFLKPFGVGKGELLPNPFGRGSVSIRAYLKLINFKANHRKVIVGDDGGRWSALITSANPHDASWAHDNVAIKFSGDAVLALLTAENSVVQMSGDNIILPKVLPLDSGSKQDAQIRIISEAKIKQQLLAAIEKAQKDDALNIAVFYLSDRDIVMALAEAAGRGTKVRVILDPNKDAFGMERDGVPNRQTAGELVRAGAFLKWCHTNGEQCHSKVLLADYVSGASVLIMGSANFTRRNLDDLNLELNVEVTARSDAEIIQSVRDWYEALWLNTDGPATVNYQTYADDSALRVMKYRIMEFTGISTF